MIFDNENLEDIWELESHAALEIRKGGVSIQVNRRLCQDIVLRFTERLILPNKTRSLGADLGGLQLASNGDKAACRVDLIQLQVDGVQHDSAYLAWNHSETHGKDADTGRYILAQVIYYREAPHRNLTKYRYTREIHFTFTERYRHAILAKIRDLSFPFCTLLYLPRF